MDGVIKARIQTVEEIYRLVWAAIADKRRIGAVYKERPRLFCPHRSGRSRPNSYGSCAMAETVRADWRRSGRRITGVLLSSRIMEGGVARRPLADGPESLPSSPVCVLDADIDTKDHPERNPQKGQ